MRPPGTEDVRRFDHDEDAYIAWVTTHPAGFVANMDRAGNVPQYPMIHRASHAAVHSHKIGHFTTGDYVKYCALDLQALQACLMAKYRRQPTFCANCMGTDRGHDNGKS